MISNNVSLRGSALFYAGLKLTDFELETGMTRVNNN